ncbi:hypothetical protein F2Q68_00024519 [Brassica cretica]|uniref:Uncharacterized protein n=1 Tax=Brassica cretica TaxID=69181 RepID=A0A8S9ICY4_BRACR|nr:hypothetical protein F2Q68_00024519 [Brassica cretica]
MAPPPVETISRKTQINALRRTGSVLLPLPLFTLAAARSPLHCTTTSDSVCLLIVSLGVNLVKHLLLPTDGFRFQIYNFIWGKTRFFSLFLGIAWKGMTLVIRLDVSSWDGTYRRFGFLVLRIRNHSRPLPQYEDLMLLVSHRLTQYEAVRHLFCLPLPQYEVHLLQYKGYLTRHEPWWFLQLYTSLWLRISSQFQGSSSWCLITSVAKFLAALYAFVAAACSGSSSLNVFSNSHGFISLSSTHVVSLLSCLCVMFAFIYVCAIRCAFDAAVYLANVDVLLFLLNNSSIDGV